MTCRELVELVTDYLDGALAPALVVGLERHLDGCDGCTQYVAQMRATVRATGSSGAPERPDRAGLLQAFRRFRADR